MGFGIVVPSTMPWKLSPSLQPTWTSTPVPLSQACFSSPRHGSSSCLHLLAFIPPRAGSFSQHQSLFNSPLHREASSDPPIQSSPPHPAILPVALFLYLFKCLLSVLPTIYYSVLPRTDRTGFASAIAELAQKRESFSSCWKNKYIKNQGQKDQYKQMQGRRN